MSLLTRTLENHFLNRKFILNTRSPFRNHIYKYTNYFKKVTKCLSEQYKHHLYKPDDDPTKAKEVCTIALSTDTYPNV